MLKNKKYIFAFVCMFILSVFAFNFVHADEVTKADKDEVFDSVATEGVYKFSDNTKDIYLPFMRFATDRIIFDKEVNKIGASFSTKSIEVNAPTKNIQVLFSSDSIRVNAPMEYGILFANGDITINSKIEKNLILFATGTITVEEDAVLNDDVICFSNNLEFKGTVNGSLLGSVGTANISGTIANDLRINSEDVKFSSEKNVGKNVYVETYNNELNNIKEKYTNAIIKIQEVKKESAFDFGKVFSLILTSVIFAVLYLIINKVSKKQCFENVLNKVKTNYIMVIVSGTVALLAIIPAAFILIILSVLGLWVVAIPVMLVYAVALIIIAMLQVFITGSVLYTYIKGKYLKEAGTGTDILGTICMFLVLSLLTKIPFVGGYISIILYILAIGIVFTCIFKKEKKA